METIVKVAKVFIAGAALFEFVKVVAKIGIVVSAFFFFFFFFFFFIFVVFVFVLFIGIFCSTRYGRCASTTRLL